MNGGHQPRRVSGVSKRTANELLGQLENDVASYVGQCLFVIDDNGAHCGESVSNNCHVVSESAVLVGMRDDKTKKVRELQWGVSQWRKLLFSSEVEQRVWDTATFDPSESTTRDTCVGRFACKQPYDHDGQFKPIDVAEPDFDDPVVCFLARYRIALFVADQYRKAVWLRENWKQKMQESLNREARRSAERRNRHLRGSVDPLDKELQQAESTVGLLGKNWHARKSTGTLDPNTVSAEVFGFRSKLRLAGCVSYGRGSAVTVFPGQEDWHTMGVLYLTSESDLARGDCERLAGVSRASRETGDYGVTVTNELMTNGWGILAVSPGSYEELNDRDRFTIQSLVAKHTRDVEL